MPTFSDDQVQELYDQLTIWFDREDDLKTNLVARDYRTDAGNEFARHGFGRRLANLRHAIERVFETIPPETEQPDDEALRDAELFIQSFIINVFGSLDNMARILSAELDITQPNGNPLRANMIGLGPRNFLVRGRLSRDFQNYLATSGDWFDYIEDYRHALAHRVPLYIPRRQFNDDDAVEYRRLEAEIAAARHDYQLMGALMARQRNIGEFNASMMHSYYQPARPVMFHPQLINDFSTIVEIGEAMLVELDNHPE